MLQTLGGASFSFFNEYVCMCVCVCVCVCVCYFIIFIFFKGNISE